MSPLHAWLARLIGRWLDLPAPSAPGEPLPGFQRCAWLAVEAALRQHQGAVLADEVGLGKTHVALAALLARGQGAVLAPASLHPMWRAHLDRVGLGHLPLWSHSWLARHHPTPAPGLLVVDEAQAFTNPHSQRARALAALARHMPLLLLSATPMGLHRQDLAHLLRLFCPPDSLRPVLGQPLERWLDQGGLAEHPWPLLQAVLIRRPRSLIQQRHPQGVRLPDQRRLYFPQRQASGLTWCLEPHTDWLLPALEALLQQLPQLSPELPPGLLRTLLLARAESSLAALERSLARLEGFFTRAIEAARHGRRLPRQSWRAAFGALAVDEDRQQVLPFFFPHPGADQAPSRAHLEHARLTLRQLRQRLQQTPDPKLPRLLPALDHLRQHQPGQPAVIFTRSVETAHALWRNLQAQRPKLATGLLVGSGARLGGPHKPWSASPQEVLYRLLQAQRPGERLDLLITTDVLSEGVNMQACRLLVSYDLPWNPRRLIQRHGRADRLGLERRQLTLLALRPGGALEQALQLSTRVQQRSQRLRRDLGDAQGLTHLFPGDPQERTTHQQHLAAATLLELRRFYLDHHDLAAPTQLGWRLPHPNTSALVALRASPGRWPLRWWRLHPGQPPAPCPPPQAWALLRDLPRHQPAPLHQPPAWLTAPLEQLRAEVWREHLACALAPWPHPRHSHEARAQRLLAQATDHRRARLRQQAQRRLRVAPPLWARHQLEALLDQNPDAEALEALLLSWPEPATTPRPREAQTLALICWG